MRITGMSMMICMILMMSFSGCGGKDVAGREELPKGQEASEESRTAPVEETVSTEDVFATELSLEEEWRDNTLDDYTATIHVPLRSEQSEGEIAGGSMGFALGNTRGALFRKHLLNPVEDCWDELKTVTNQREENSVRLAFREDTHNQAWGIGSIIGSDHFMMLDWETPGDAEGGRGYYFFEIDEELQIVRRVFIDFLSEQEIPGEFMVDKAGNIHFITSHLYEGGEEEKPPLENQSGYYVVDSNGTLLAEYDYSGISTRLTALYDGRVAIGSSLVNNEGKLTGSRLECMDRETGKLVSLVEWEEKASQVYYTLWDEKTLLYADSKGLHFADLSGNITGDIYTWLRHGVQFSQMEELQIQENGCISLIYSDSKGGNLLCLKPTEEREEIKRIVFAVQPYMKEIYSFSVAEFNKRYPAYHIEMKTDYEETALLTELISGTGPVLIDTQLTGFEEHKKLWTPLEGLFQGEEWEDVLLPKAMEMGEIDGTLYGVVNSFALDTVVIAQEEPEDWDYKAFLDGIENRDSLQAVFNGQNGLASFVVNFLIHGLEDNYLLDAENGTVNFDSDEFRRVLRLGMAYCDEEAWIEPGESLLEGKVFCNTVSITRPELIDLYRYIYGEDIHYIGYPSKDGAAHYMDSLSPLAIRVTASDEEKRVAGAFIRLLLSREGQLESSANSSNFWLSVRRDVLEEQINQVNEWSYPTVYGFPQIMLGDRYDRELDAALLYELLETARPKKGFPRELNSILVEELQEYAAGAITEDILIERLTKRVGLYLAERQGRNE
ncbi:MAG: hypothetical protein NC081_04755 [Roseburia sp.]|nr:hypothetical protein [Roseburia sp.]